MTCTRNRSNAAILLIALAYVLVVCFYDLYLFESTILVQNWVKTNKNLRKNSSSQVLFNFNKDSVSYNGSRRKVILYWKPFFGALYTTPHVCPGCIVTYDHSAVTHADAVVFHCAEIRDDPSWLPWEHRSIKQRWVWMCMEPPWNVRHVFEKTLTPLNNVFNWTMTYRVDSDVLSSYEMVNFKPVTLSTKEILASKNATALGAWVVSNCHASQRREFIEEMKKFIAIHEYGKCSKVKLCREPRCQKAVLSSYKFYFSLENSVCKDYISEKFWLNSLASRAVPVVMGPSKSDYQLVAPPHSFIHVDDFKTTKELAEYLIKLDKDDELYAQYLKWWSNPNWKEEQIPKAREAGAKGLLGSRMQGTKVGICGLCQKLKHEPVEGQSQVVRDLDQWWYGAGYSPHKDSIKVCGGGESGLPLRRVLTFGYSMFFASLALAVYVLSRKAHKTGCICRKCCHC